MMKIFFLFFSYLLGSIPSGYLIYRLSEKDDIRKYGSHSTGATNILRLKGWKYALPVVLIDLIKGMLPVIAATSFFSDTTFTLICGCLAVFGHCFPVYIKFRGGKGVVTTIGVYAIIMFKPLLFSLATFLIIIFLTRYVSLGSILSVLSFPFYALLYNGESRIVYFGIAVSLIVFVKHLGNVKRLIYGNERKLGEKII